MIPHPDHHNPAGTPPPPAATPVAKGPVFLRRLGSTVVLWSVVLTAIFSTNRFVREYVFLGFILLLAWAGLREFYDLVERRGLICFRRWGVFHGLLLMVATFYYLTHATGHQRLPSKANDFETSVLVVFVLGLCVRQLAARNNPAGLIAVSTTLFGLLYVPWLLNFIQKITFFPGIDGRFYVLYFIGVTKFSDLGAYVIGSLFGRHKMIPRISPGKTWEGFGGALVISTATSLIFASVAGDKLPGMTPIHAVLLGVVLGCSAVVGDLIESAFKREAGVKDSGKLFPGIGGILDLLDSLLFNAPLMYLYLRHVIARGLTDAVPPVY